MFRGRSEIEPVVELLEARECSLWHACQLKDFESYLYLGGIPSRLLLERAGKAFTPYATDSNDRASGVWPKVFVNLADFGRAFASASAAVPNTYGPIALQVRPNVLLRATDVSITLRSAGARDFDRVVESLTSVEDLNRVFMHGPADNPFDRADLLFGDRLRTAFAPLHPLATSAEISLTIDPGLVPLDDVIAIWVDPLAVHDRSLLDVVAGLMRAAGRSRPVLARYVNEQRKGIYAELVAFVADGGRPNLRLLAGRMNLSEPTRVWASALLDRDAGWQFERFCRYLNSGTLDVLRADPRTATPLGSTTPVGLRG